MLHILFTGTRDVRDPEKAEELIRSLLLEAVRAKAGPENVRIIHGAAVGIDQMADRIAKDMGVEREPWPAHLFYTPLVRNKFMVNLGRGLVQDGDEVVVWAFARTWASGTGHCARHARQAGLTVIDYGVSTA